jgi:hypothetical protein
LFVLMTIYWTARQIPEFSHFTAREARKALSICWRKGVIKFPEALGVAFFWAVAGPFFLAMYLGRNEGSQGGDVNGWLLYTCAGLLAVLSAELLLSFLIESARPRIREYLAAELSGKQSGPQNTAR